MSQSNNPDTRVRMSVRELCQPENSEKLNAFLRAWKLIKALPTDNPNSYWAIAGYHGEPFRPRTDEKENQNYWGGYCQHANVLFPTWHRFYVLRLEQALRTVCPEDDVTMAYWDETSEKNLEEGIPPLLVADCVTIDGEEVVNPLKSFILPEAIGGEEADKYYAKPKEYETVRYPFSGIQSPECAKLKALEHNKTVAGIDGIEDALGTNIAEWLNRSVLQEYENCLETPNYNQFSNTTSSNSSNCFEMSLEQPHNGIHLAVGGYSLGSGTDDGIIKGANGDMGENETAGFDPAFFFHHCNIDRMFWVWQKKQGFTDTLVIDASDKDGTNTSSDEGQGPTPGQGYNEQLTMTTILYPFQHPNGVPVTSEDCVNIESQLGYKYTTGSLDRKEWPPIQKPHTALFQFSSFKDMLEKLKSQCETIEPRVIFYNIELPDLPRDIHTVATVHAGIEWHRKVYLKISNINANLFSGSFVVQAYYKTRDSESFIGQRGILQRWAPKLCRNCQFHRRVSVFFDVTNMIMTCNWPPRITDFKVQVICRDPENCTEAVHNLTEEIEEGKQDGNCVLNLAVVFTPK